MQSEAPDRLQRPLPVTRFASHAALQFVQDGMSRFPATSFWFTWPVAPQFVQRARPRPTGRFGSPLGLTVRGLDG